MSVVIDREKWVELTADRLWESLRIENGSYARTQILLALGDAWRQGERSALILLKETVSATDGAK